jgi:hypothetical protein
VDDNCPEDCFLVLISPVRISNRILLLAVKQGSMLNGSIYKKMEKALIGIKSVSESY